MTRPIAILFGWAVCGPLFGAGCQREAVSTPSPPASQPASPGHAEAPSESVPDAADASRDDPASPDWLPRPDEIPGWLRTSNVQTIYPGEWHRLQHGRLKDAAEALSVRCAFSFQVAATLPQPGCATAQILLIEGATSDDAYGVALAMISPNATHDLVGTMSAFEDEGNTRVVHGWQGNYYLHVRMTRPLGPPPEIGVEKLAAGLFRPLPSVDSPSLLSCLPAAGRVPGRLWLTRRHLHVFPEHVHREVLLGSGLETTKALGLSGDTLMAIAAYSPGENERLNYVWVVKYLTPEAAMEAAGRYKNILRKMKPTPLVQMELPGSAEGRSPSPYLVGTWTADQESIMHIMPQIVAKLPPP